MVDRLVPTPHARDEPLLRFTIEDTGVGPAAGQIAKLFRPFAQADAATTRKYGGTGLGLIICKRLTELMRGKIWVESTPGQSSKFSFAIRVGQVAPSTSSQTSASPASRRGDALRSPPPACSAVR